MRCLARIKQIDAVICGDGPVVNKLLRGQYIFLTGILGAVSHNAGQILAAFFILRLSGIFAYMPFLVISGVITGLFTGLVCFFADRYIPKKYTI